MSMAMMSPVDLSLSGDFLYRSMVANESPFFAIITTALGSWILALAIAMVAISVWLRNSIEMSGYQDENTRSISIPKTLLAGLAFAMAALMILSGSPSVFLYFNF